MMNQPVLEAKEDLRQAKLTGAVLGASNGREYMEFLGQTAHWDDVMEFNRFCDQLAVAEAQRGLPGPTPASEAPEIEDIGG